jgi:hypothetical protein
MNDDLSNITAEAVCFPQVSSIFKSNSSFPLMTAIMHGQVTHVQSLKREAITNSEGCAQSARTAITIATPDHMLQAIYMFPIPPAACNHKQGTNCTHHPMAPWMT